MSASEFYVPDENVLHALEELDYGEERVLPVAKLEVPKEFQRDNTYKNREWVNGFIPALFGRPVVFIIDGHYLVVSGQHRIEHAKTFSETDVPCLVFEGPKATLKVAAALFHFDATERKALRTPDEFRAACVSGDRNAIKLDKALRERGLDGWCRARSVKDLGAISSVLTLAKDHGFTHTLYTLDVINECWPFADVNASPHARVIRGFGQFFLPEKRVKGRDKPRRWNPNDRDLLIGYITSRYDGQTGLADMLALAQSESPGGGGGGGSKGMESILEKTLRRAKSEAKQAA